MIEQLRKCPFCGGRLEFTDDRREYGGVQVATPEIYVICKGKCKTQFHSNRKTQLKQAQIINTRTVPAQLEREWIPIAEAVEMIIKPDTRCLILYYDASTSLCWGDEFDGIDPEDTPITHISLIQDDDHD